MPHEILYNITLQKAGTGLISSYKTLQKSYKFLHKRHSKCFLNSGIVINLTINRKKYRD